MTDLTWAEFRSIMIIEKLRSGNPEPLIKFMREGGDMTSFGDYGLDVIEKTLRRERLRGPGRPKSEKSDPNRNTEVLFHVAWCSEMEGFPLTHPRYTKNSAFHKASAAMGNKVTPERACDLWEECADKDYFRKAVRD